MLLHREAGRKVINEALRQRRDFQRPVALIFVELASLTAGCAHFAPVVRQDIVHRTALALVIHCPADAVLMRLADAWLGALLPGSGLAAAFDIGQQIAAAMRTSVDDLEEKATLVGVAEAVSGDTYGTLVARAYLARGARRAEVF